jgi:hypothetical protein
MATITESISNREILLSKKTKTKIYPIRSMSIAEPREDELQEEKQQKREHNKKEEEEEEERKNIPEFESEPSPLPDIPLPPPTTIPTEILSIDQDTPDSHVPRDPRLIRLTGVHPFNVEPPLTELFNEGFLTSPELFYVRNHGPVPHVRDEDIPTWEISVEGYVLLKYPPFIRHD